MSKLVFASVISEIQQSDVFMSVKARICEAPEANLNGARVTEAFIDEIVSNEERYVGLPLYADKKALISGNYNRLGHLYDVKTGEFHSTQVGSFYKFEKQPTNKGCALIGYARIPKRNKKLSKAISELFADGNLKFSFELSVGEYEELDDNTILIDASENNYLEGTAIVTYPACEDAVALELVAQKTDGEGECEMAEVEKKTEVAETEVQPETAETEKVETPEETTTENSEEETGACKKKEKAETETATVYVTEIDEQSHTTHAYDSETGKSVSQTVEVRTVTDEPIDGNIVETVDGIHVAEEIVAEGEDTTEDPTDPTPTDPNPADPNSTGSETTEPTDPPGSDTTEPSVPAVTTEPADENTGGNTGSTTEEEPAADGTEIKKKKTAEQSIAELLEIVESLKTEIAELKKQKETTVVGEVNPFMESINTQSKYSLLEADTPTKKYTLL